MLGCCCYRSFHMYGSIWFMGERKRKKNDFIVGIFAIVFCLWIFETNISASALTSQHMQRTWKTNC